MNMNQPPLPLAPLTDGLKVAFDIGGVISRYPEHMKQMMYALARGGVKVYILTDMQLHQAKACLKENGFDFVDENLILSAIWQDHGDLCKTHLMKEHGIHVLIDDRPDYASFGDFIGMFVLPRPVPYYHPDWKNPTVAPTIMVPAEEMEEYQRWKAAKISAGTAT